ncbi:MAG: hemolysin family protein [Naasia sp.]
MDVDTLWNLALVMLFILIGGIFAGTELAIVSLRESQIKGIEESGDRGRKIGKLVRDPNLFLSAVQVGVTLAGFFSSAYGAATLSPDLVPLLVGIGLPADVAGTVAFIGMTLFIAYLSLVFGELVPKRLAMQRSIAFTKVLAPPLGALARLMKPIIWLLSVSTNAVVRLLGGDPSVRSDTVTREEVRDLIVSNPDITDDSKSILEDVFRVHDRRLVEVMRPRPDVEFLRGDMTVAEARIAVTDLTHSRFPVMRDTVDDIVGFIHVKDLLAAGPDLLLSAVARDILPLPTSVRVLDALSAMRKQKSQIVLVVDEYGGTEGIATMEDLVEELVGEIYDEYDDGQDPEDSHRRLGRVVEVDGGLIIDELEEIAGTDIPEGGYETVAGFILDRLGRLADVGDRVEYDGFVFTVTAVEGNRILRVRVEPEEQTTELGGTVEGAVVS